MSNVFIRHERRDLNKKNIAKQKEEIIKYSQKNGLAITREYIETYPTSLLEIKNRKETIQYFQSLDRFDNLIVYDIWVFSLYPQDLVQIMSCLLKNGVTIYFAKRELEINANSSAILVLGLIDEIRKENEKILIKNNGSGRPKGSLSRSKFDGLKDQIISLLREDIKISEISRILDVTRSSLNDYIKSRRLKEIAVSFENQEKILNREEILNSSNDKLIQNIECPTT